jgi:Putative transposase
VRDFHLHVSRGLVANSIAVKMAALQHHPHVHCIVPGGGLSPDGERWCAPHESGPGLSQPGCL